jgi:nitroreductase
MTHMNPRTPSHPIEAQFLSRWSPRGFDGHPLTEAEVLPCLEAARWAPSSGNSQPWRYVLALGGTPGFAAVLAGLAASNQVWAQRAGALIVACSLTSSIKRGERKPLGSSAFDAGAAWMSLALQAQAQGLATHAMGGFDAAAVGAAIGLGEHARIDCVIAIGRPDPHAPLSEDLRAREVPNDRLPLVDLVVMDRWTFSAE